MLDLESLRIIRREEPSQRRFSFVGVRLSPDDSIPEFWLPQGFQNFPSNNFDVTIELFFDLFRVVRTFVTFNPLRDDQRSDKRDPLQLGENGLRFDNAATTPVLTFAKLNVLEDVLASFDEVVLSAVVSKDARRHPETHEAVHRHLHEAVFLEDDRIYFESLPAQRQEIETGPTQLVRLFCYVFSELASRVGDAARLSPEVLANASAFKEEHLHESAGLFVESSFKTTLDTLKEALDRIDRTTPYKDDDFWQLFSAVEVFLYGDITRQADEDGIVWGISDFHPIWEEMCHSFARDYFERRGNRRVLFAHSPQGANTSIAGQRVYNGFDRDFPFVVELGSDRRYMLPDMVADNGTEPSRKLDDLLSVTRAPLGADFYSQVTVRPSSGSAAAAAWAEDIRSSLTKAGWHAQRSKSQDVYRKIPAWKFEGVYRKASERFARQVARDPKTFILDFKYHHPHEYCGASLSIKLQEDILKQHVYELAWQFHQERTGQRSEIISQFVVPLYAAGTEPISISPSEMPEEMGALQLSTAFVESGIELVAVPFNAAMQAYVACR